MGYNGGKNCKGVLAMKKFVSGLLAGIIIATSLVVMAATGIKEAYFNNAVKLIVDGKEIKTEIVTVTPEGQINGKNYVSVRDLAEALGATVTWDGAKKEIQISTRTNTEVDYSGWVPYSTSNLELLIDNIKKGYVVYYNGQYLASPEYVEMISNEEVVYENDVSNDSSNNSGRRSLLTPDAEYKIVDD